MPAFASAYLRGIDANRTIKDELIAATGRRSARRRISVTDLVNPRQAYFQRIHPEIQPSEARLGVMMAGSGFHDAFERAVSTEEFVEQLVEYEGIVGKIDIFEDSPLELKTTAAIPEDVLVFRPSQAEQLAMYCVMTERPHGYLLYYRRAEFGRPPQLRAFDLHVLDREAIGTEMQRRRDLLRTALESSDPSALPRCEWAERGCDYSGICGCETAPPLARAVTEMTVRVEKNPGLEQRLLQNITALPALRMPLIRLHDLVMPRRAAYRLMRGGEPDEGVEDRMRSFQRQGLLRMIEEAMWYGAAGNTRWMRQELGQVRASIMLFREVPTILRVSGRWEMVERRRLPFDAPHYVDRLAFECALAGTEAGRLVLYYSAIPEDKFMVYDLGFTNLPAIRVEMQRRLDLLEAGTAPSDLPPCLPAWMSKFCAFGDVCGCGVLEDPPPV